jgi:hypothetical protein
LAIGVPVVTTKALLGEIETNHAGGRCHWETKEALLGSTVFRQMI